MPAHATTTRPQRVKLPRKDDSGHLIRTVGHYYECSCGAVVKGFGTRPEAQEASRQHVRDHSYEALPPTIPPPGTVPPPAAGEATR